MNNVDVMQVDHRLNQLEHEAFDLGKRKKLAFIHHLINQFSKINAAVFKNQKDALRLVASHYLLQQDNIFA